MVDGREYAGCKLRDRNMEGISVNYYTIKNRKIHKPTTILERTRVLNTSCTSIYAMVNRVITLVTSDRTITSVGDIALLDYLCGNGLVDELMYRESTKDTKPKLTDDLRSIITARIMVSQCHKLKTPTKKRQCDHLAKLTSLTTRFKGLDISGLLTGVDARKIISELPTLMKELGANQSRFKTKTTELLLNNVQDDISKRTKRNKKAKKGEAITITLRKFSMVDTRRANIVPEVVLTEKPVYEYTPIPEPEPIQVVKVVSTINGKIEEFKTLSVDQHCSNSTLVSLYESTNSMVSAYLNNEDGLVVDQLYFDIEALSLAIEASSLADKALVAKLNTISKVKTFLNEYVDDLSDYSTGELTTLIASAHIIEKQGTNVDTKMLDSVLDRISTELVKRPNL